MVFPAIKLHQLYSLSLYDELNIIFEDLDMINMDNLKKIVTTKQLGYIQIVDRSLTMNTNTNSMTIVGNKINDSTYIVKRDGSGDIFILTYKCTDETILTGLEYLYHMHKSIKGA
jgi:hypothetical protein